MIGLWPNRYSLHAPSQYIFNRGNRTVGFAVGLGVDVTAVVGAYVEVSVGIMVGSEEGLAVVGTIVGAMVGAAVDASVVFSVSVRDKKVTFEREISMLSASSLSEDTCFSDGHQKQNHVCASSLVELVVLAPSRLTPLDCPSLCSNTKSLFLEIARIAALPTRTQKSAEKRIFALLMVATFAVASSVILIASDRKMKRFEFFREEICLFVRFDFYKLVT